MTSFVTEGWFPAAPYEAGVRGSRTTVEQLGRTSHGGGGGGTALFGLYRYVPL